MMNPLMLSAVEVHQIVGISLLVITVLSWFVNFIQGNNPDGSPRPQKNKSKPQTARSEIEALLSELNGDKRKPKPEQKEPQPRPVKALAERPRSKPKNAPQRPGAPPPYSPSRSPRPIEGKLPTANLGDGVRSSQLGNPIEAAVQKDIVSAVQSDLSSRPVVAAPERPVHPFVKLLRDPNGARQAIILSEILSRRGSSPRR